MNNEAISLELFMWILGGYSAAAIAAWGLIWWRMNRLDKKVEGHDERMRQGITYEQADTLIDLKLRPIADALEKNTRATERLTEVMLERN